MPVAKFFLRMKYKAPKVKKAIRKDVNIATRPEQSLRLVFQFGPSNTSLPELPAAFAFFTGVMNPLSVDESRYVSHAQ